MKFLNLLVLAVLLSASVVSYAYSPVANKLSSIASRELNRPLTLIERQIIDESIDKSLQGQSTSAVGQAASDRVTSVYACVGGKLAIVAIGAQGLKCVHFKTGQVVTVVFNSERGASPETGWVASGNVGLNLGVAIDVAL